MIGNPMAAAVELGKYLKIIGVAKEALRRASSGTNNNDMIADLKRKLDDCEFTKIIPGYTGEVAPLHSSTAYINNIRALTEQVEKADDLAKKLLDEISKTVGPLYSEKDIAGMTQTAAEKTLEESWPPGIVVKTFLDTNKGICIQVDSKGRRYRTAPDGGSYGPWKSFN